MILKIINADIGIRVKSADYLMKTVRNFIYCFKINNNTNCRQ